MGGNTMWKKCFVFLFMLMMLTVPVSAKGWIFYGTTDSGLQMFYNSDLITTETDSHDNQSMTLVWIGAQNPKKGFVDDFYYVGFKDSPSQYAILGEVKCTKNGKITKQKKYPKAKWEETKKSNLMYFLYQQVTSQVKKQASSAETSTTQQANANTGASIEANYIGNKKTGKFHTPNCKWVKRINSQNKVGFQSRDEAEKAGFSPCQVCNP